MYEQWAMSAKVKVESYPGCNFIYKIVKSVIYNI